MAKLTYSIDTTTCKTCGKTYMHMHRVFLDEDAGQWNPEPFNGSNESICPFCNHPNDFDSRSVRNGKEE